MVLLWRIWRSLFAFEITTVTLCLWECNSHSLLLRKQHSLSFWECDHHSLLLRIQQSLFTLFFLSHPPTPTPPSALCFLIFFLLIFNTGSGVLFCMAQSPVTETMNLCYENKWKHWNSLLCCANWQSSDLFILFVLHLHLCYIRGYTSSGVYVHCIYTHVR